MVYIVSNWYDIRLIKLFGLSTGGGILIFPFTFLLSDLITEVYGYKYARRAIWCGFLFNGIFSLYGIIISYFTYPPYDIKTEFFDHLMIFDSRIILASAITYLLFESVNSFILAKLKILMQGKYMGIRFLISTILASGLDTFIFCLIGFYGAIKNEHLFNFIFFSFIIKISVEILGLPFSIRFTKKLKQIENLDIYDKNTNFSIFSLDTSYAEKDNKFDIQSSK